MKEKILFVCNSCGATSPKWMGKCNECGEWDSYVEEVVQTNSVKKNKIKAQKIETLKDVTISSQNRTKIGIVELDRVLGGGIVDGSLILVGGDPGIGKSTLLLQVASNLSTLGKKVLYVSGEESKIQIKLRANRLNVNCDHIFMLSENDFETMEVAVNELKPDILIVDSIQTISTQMLSSPPGSVSQVREVTSSLMKIAKSNSIATFVVGHVTKSGSIAGPKILEHIVDTVLYFEGDNTSVYRILRSVKNRFGSTNEVGLFTMSEMGLVEVTNPSELFLSNGATNKVGTTIFVSMEGTRPLLVEIQSLVAKTNFPSPRRMGVGIDYNKLIVALAILEKKSKIYLQSFDVYVSAVGGISLSEPAMSLAMMISVASSFYNKSLPNDVVVFGEVGLLGEVRKVSHMDKRLVEAKRLGYTVAVAPKMTRKIEGIKLIEVESIKEAIDILFK